MTKYSEIKELLNINHDNNLTAENAYITHFLHHSQDETNPFREKALKYIRNRVRQDDLIESEIAEIYWDIPFPPPENPIFKFIDLFAGIGGFRIALQNLGGKCVFSSEIDNSAKKTYEMNFGEIPFGDIKGFTDASISDEEINILIPDHNVLAAGFPCQPFSLAGVSARNSLGQDHGFLDMVKGTLFFDLARIVKVKKPEIVFLENVKNFKVHDNGKTYATVRKTLEDMNYSIFSEIINSESLVPQSRQRFYMVGFRKKPSDFSFPKFETEPKKLGNFLEKIVPENYTISDKLWEGHIKRTKRNLDRGTGFTANLADLDKPAKTLVARYGKDGKECLIPQKDKNPRKLTPRECARLQGFPESFLLPVSNAAAYKQFGNSVAVPVIQSIAQNILKYL